MPTEALTAQNVRSVCIAALQAHRVELDWFQTFRNKIGAHSEAGFSMTHLPSKEAMEQLFRFGMAFYKLVRSMHGDLGPANASATANPAFVRLLHAAGFHGLKMRYEEEEN